MKTFVIAFRRTSPPLADDVRLRLNQETAAWARSHSNFDLDPRILGRERAVFNAPADQPDKSAGLSALLFLEAPDLASAGQVAAAHPGLRYGFSVEVRSWTKPVAAASR
ncbi:MAG TPA: hypothetical protein VHD32_17005 [Candidatus Didemnitutus sp.]|nr:hypothetical protein [Candidatus Didemnitutus sp.]